MSRSPRSTAPSADRVRRWIADRVSEGCGMVVVTHHVAEVWDLATRVAVLLGGTWACDEAVAGTAEAFVTRYQAMTGA